MPTEGRWRAILADRERARSKAAGWPVVALLTTGCFDAAAVQAARDVDTEGDESSGATTTHGSTGATTITTTTGTSSAEPASTGEASSGGPSDVGSGGDDQGEAPTIESFELTPSGSIQEAMPLTFSLDCSADVIEVELVEVIGDAKSPIATLTPADFPYQHLIVNADDNGHRTFAAIVRGEGGATATSPTRSVEIGLPPGGVTIWSAHYSDAVGEVLGVAPYAGGVATAGFEVIGLTLVPRVSRYDRNGEVKWSEAPDQGSGYATGVAIDADDNLIVVGNRWVGDYQAMWIRRLSPHGYPIPSAAIDGVFGERALGVAAAPSGRFYVVGDILEPGSTKVHNLRVHGFLADGSELFLHTWDRQLGADALAHADDQAHAVAVLEDGDIAVVGSSGVESPDTHVVHNRALVRRYTASGALLGSWIDDGSPFSESQAASVASDRQGGLLVGGRTGANLNTFTSPVVYRFDESMDMRWKRLLAGGAPGASVTGVAMSLADNAVVAATIAGQCDDTDVFLGELDGQTGSGSETWNWKAPIDVNNLVDRVNALGVGPYGELFFAGMATMNDGPRALVRRVAP